MAESKLMSKPWAEIFAEGVSEWKDITSYSRGEERVPRTWEYKAGEFRVVVARLHGLDDWYLTIYGICEQLPMKEADIEAAKKVSLNVFREVLEASLKALPEGA